MKFDLEKSLKILNELISYFHTLGNNNIHTDLYRKDKKTYFHISGKVSKVSNVELTKLNNILNTPRQLDIEQDYWQLGGESEYDCELTLVGMMIDKATINYTNDILTVDLIRNDI